MNVRCFSRVIILKEISGKFCGNAALVVHSFYRKQDDNRVFKGIPIKGLF